MQHLRRVAGLVAQQRFAFGDRVAAELGTCRHATPNTFIGGNFSRALASGSGNKPTDDAKPADDAAVEEAGSSPETPAAPTQDAAAEPAASPQVDAAASPVTETETVAVEAGAANAADAEALHFEDEAVVHLEGLTKTPIPPVDHINELPIDRAVRHKYGAWGISADDLRAYIETSLDIEDALSQGATPQLAPERYSHYKAIREVVEGGADWSEEETEWVNRNLVKDMLALPWPSIWKRDWLRSMGGQVGRLRKHQQTTYDQGWMAEALIPFQSHEEMVAHSEGRPTADDPTSFYPDEIDDDGVITRRPHSAAGQVDMSDWASVLRASARARAAAADAPDSAAAEATAPGVEGVSGAVSASAEASEGDASSPAAAAATATVVSEADEEELWAGLEDLDDGAEISDTMLGLQPVGKAVYQAALDGQAASLLRRYGFAEDAREDFCEKSGLSAAGFEALVEGELEQQMKLFDKTPTENRSPSDFAEDVVPSKRRVGFFGKPLYDMRTQLMEQENSPFSENNYLPEFLQVLRREADAAVRMQHPDEDVHPAVEQAFLKGLTDGDTSEDAVPELVDWDQVVWLHTGTASYHPGNGRVRLRVDARKLQAHYALSDAALTHVLKVAGSRYNKNTGLLKISCGKHRAREDNRRQALHWLIRLVESGHLAHPNAAWDSMKQRQNEFVEAIL